MRDKKVIILIVVLVLGGISLIYGITASPKGKTKAVYTNEDRAPADLRRAPAQTAASTHRRAKKSKFASWKRSPFVPSGSPASPVLVLNGIMWDKTSPTAMIGDTIVKKGDKIGGNTVIEITPDKVVLNDGTKDIGLRLSQ